jgi:hypothetical protein
MMTATVSSHKRKLSAREEEANHEEAANRGTSFPFLAGDHGGRQLHKDDHAFSPTDDVLDTFKDDAFGAKEDAFSAKDDDDDSGSGGVYYDVFAPKPAFVVSNNARKVQRYCEAASLDDVAQDITEEL